MRLSVLCIFFRHISLVHFWIGRKTISLSLFPHAASFWLDREACESLADKDEEARPWPVHEYLQILDGPVEFERCIRGLENAILTLPSLGLFYLVLVGPSFFYKGSVRDDEVAGTFSLGEERLAMSFLLPQLNGAGSRRRHPRPLCQGILGTWQT
ncbi:hypothetical protein AMTR_s00068p00096670 [Amborella trichopoda]|uniref:Uncharacterized protein n=1 Tax=Amborella trichopoda TaxID=13333 RepID=U5DIJ8_AMBTC|nr:hypothetical protein AMTR_s00068p00096670 [Amborella trichopoda]